MEIKTLDTTKAELKIFKHINKVSSLMTDFATLILKRGIEHDKSKLSQVELIPLQKLQDAIDSNGECQYGTDEYNERLKILKPMLDNHYQLNSHHPEYHKSSINSMDILDIVEMLADWKASSERGDGGIINLSYSIERFKIDKQLSDIIKATFNNMGWKYK